VHVSCEGSIPIRERGQGSNNASHLCSTHPRQGQGRPYKASQRSGRRSIDVSSLEGQTILTAKGTKCPDCPDKTANYGQQKEGQVGRIGGPVYGLSLDPDPPATSLKFGLKVNAKNTKVRREGTEKGTHKKPKRRPLAHSDLGKPAGHCTLRLKMMAFEQTSVISPKEAKEIQRAYVRQRARGAGRKSAQGRGGINGDHKQPAPYIRPANTNREGFRSQNAQFVVRGGNRVSRLGGVKTE